jgi:hypothetical protein
MCGGDGAPGHTLAKAQSTRPETQSDRSPGTRPVFQAASAITWVQRGIGGLVHDPERLISYVLSNRYTTTPNGFTEVSQGGADRICAGQGLDRAPRRNRTADIILTMEPPGTAVRSAVSPGHARPSGPKLSVLFRRSYAFPFKPCADRLWRNLFAPEAMNVAASPSVAGACSRMFCQDAAFA